ncbi:farnesol dehydrogenase-like [Bactrocera neohumeralis]|uniref:farnesol dehydrogenase-like n=1 Tax=Bactrocera tryoni TaxID=59916 RepID=UPI001A998E84|nr:farnesol dehydrogenase-like [Bactrocera tryoni]XP_050336522.1 farnesol dehydrogenase-like [Bactrocera neohumeralis]
MFNMERWSNCTAVVTGASSGIGLAIVKDLLKENMRVAGLARRKERMEEWRATLPEEQQKRFHPVSCDVSSLESVNEAFDWVIKNLSGVDVLINNAGIYNAGQATEMDPANLQQVLQTNVMGVVYCTQRAFRSMKDRSVDGHVVIINSVLGHYVPHSEPHTPPTSNLYAPSKYALTALTEVYRQEFRGLGTRAKITSVSPGLTDTDIVAARSRGGKRPILQPEDVSRCVLFTLSTPAHMQVHEITVKPMLGE